VAKCIFWAQLNDSSGGRKRGLGQLRDLPHTRRREIKSTQGSNALPKYFSVFLGTWQFLDLLKR